MQYDIKNQNTRLSDTHKIESTALRSKNKEESAKLRAENKSVNGNLRMHTNQDNMFLREAHQEFRRVAKRQANEKWQNELARIRSDKNFRSVKISKLRR